MNKKAEAEGGLKDNNIPIIEMKRTARGRGAVGERRVLLSFDAWPFEGLGNLGALLRHPCI
jgi:hypothetical protein